MSSHSNDVPPGWALTQLGEIVEVLRGVSYKKEDASEFPGVGLVPILRATNINRRLDFDELVYVPQKYVSKEQLLMPHDIVLAASSGSRSVVGKAAPLETEWLGSFGAFCYALRPDPSVDARLIALFLQTSEYRHRVGELSAGVNINNLKREHIAGFRYPFPPLQEQHRIVSEVEKQFTRLDAAVAALQQVKGNLTRYRAAVLKAACEGGLVPTEAELARKEGRSYETGEQLLARILKERRGSWEADQFAKMRAAGKPAQNDDWKKKYKEPPSRDTSKLPKLPDGWVWVPVEMLSTRVVDGVHKKPNYVGDGIPFVTVRNLTAGPGIDFERLNHVTQSDHAEFIQRANPEYGDILVSKDGTLGVIRAIRTRRVFSIFVSVAMIKPVVREITDYLEIALMSPQVQVQMVPKGSGLQHIHLEDLRQDCIPLPPLDEQSRIVTEVQRNLSNTDFLETELEKQLGRAERLRQSVLKRAFEGKLLPQDPNDEPASVLLERIRTERAARITARPIRGKRKVAPLAAVGKG